MWISLIGFTSTGKSTVGKLLAQKANIEFYDLDRVLEEMVYKETGKQRTCREIFTEEGADAFRIRELNALNSLQTYPKIVLATGGAAPLKKEVAELLEMNGTVIYLTATPETIFERMKDKGLPAYLHSDPTIENLRNHFSLRDPVYRALADIILDTEGHTPEELANDLFSSIDILT
jgi:shikimate kinase